MMYKSCKICDSNVQVIVDNYNLGQCNNCNLIFSLEKFSDEELVKTYDNLYNKNVNSHYDVHTKYEHEKLLKGELPRIGYNRKKIIDTFIKNKSSEILEVGSGVGLIASYLKTKGITKYLGLEIDTITCKKAKNLGFNVLNKDFKHMDVIEDEFDFVMLWEVLEHLQDLDSFLSLSHQKLKKNGVLMFSVPNFDKRDNYKDNANKIYQDAPPIHLNFFNRNNLNKILPNYGFKIEYLYIKKRPYLNFKSLHFYKMLLSSMIGTYRGSSIYVAAKKI